MKFKEGENTSVVRNNETLRSKNEEFNTAATNSSLQEGKINSIKFLLETDISELPFEDRCKIKQLGRPKPHLSILQKGCVRGKYYDRKFKEEIYSRNNWIAGCNITNRFYCFPCLLFAKGNDSGWTRTGISDLGHLSQKIVRHESSHAHVNAVIDMSVLGKTGIREQLSSAFRKNIEEHNDRVRKNRYVLSKIIDCIRFCGEFELALRGNDDTTDSKNPGIFKGLINFTSALDNVMKQHVTTATIFKGNSKSLQNDLLECMLHVSREQIQKEIDAAEFVSVISEEITDVSSSFQQVVVLRYILPDGKPVERFWTLLNPAGDDVESLTSCIMNVLSEIAKKCTQKVISQSYDGASTVSGRHSCVQIRIREIYPYAYLVHCYAHQLSLIMAQAASQNRDVRIFFANLTEIPNFFAHSSQRVEVLNEVVGRKMPHRRSTRWNFNSILTIYEIKESIVECLEKTEKTSLQTTTINQAQGLRLKLLLPSFNFWLEFFYKVMAHVDVLCNTLQKPNANPVSVTTAVATFIEEVVKIRGDIDSITAEDKEVDERAPKRRCPDSVISRKVVAVQVCDVIINQASERFTFSGHLLAAALLDHTNFSEFKKSFPLTTFETVVDCYPFLIKSKLRAELEIIYRREDFSTVKTTDLLQFIIENNLIPCLGEVTKLLKLIITIPMVTAEAERCFSSLKRIKTFLKNTMEEERLNALAMLSFGKQMIGQLVDFNERVTNRFATKEERKMDFLYKHSTTASIGIPSSAQD